MQYEKSSLDNAKRMRKEMTSQEAKLWLTFLRHLPIHFYRQRPIGNYIVDFYCAKAKLVVELDGSQHYEDEGVMNDSLRDEYLNGLGIRVIRYSNYEIDKNFEAVKQDIWNQISGLL